MECAYAEVCYMYTFSGPKDPPRLLGGMFTAGIIVWDSRKRFSDDGKTGVQSRAILISVNAVGPDPTVSVAAIRSCAHPAESDAPVSASICEEKTNNLEAMVTFDITPPEEVVAVEPLKFASATLLINNLDDDAGNSVSTRQFSRKYY